MALIHMGAAMVTPMAPRTDTAEARVPQLASTVTEAGTTNGTASSGTQSLTSRHWPHRCVSERPERTAGPQPMPVRLHRCASQVSMWNLDKWLDGSMFKNV